MNSTFESGKLYKQGEVKNPYIYVSIGLVCIIIGVYYLIDSYKKNELPLYFYPIFVFTLWFMIFIIISMFNQSIYTIMCEKEIIGRNSFKKKIGEIIYDEIVEIKNMKLSYDIIIIDIHGNKLRISATMPDTVEFCNSLIEKSINCKKINLESMKKNYPGIKIYRKSER